MKATRLKGLREIAIKKAVAITPLSKDDLNNIERKTYLHAMLVSHSDLRGTWSAGGSTRSIEVVRIVHERDTSVETEGLVKGGLEYSQQFAAQLIHF